jgi:2-C-methyl-D-erythritol 2,4-cyclodiphosphate synthase
VRVGIGYDVHALVPGRRLVLGGVEVPFERGLSGWSDADVLTHAVIDALLGAAALGDIGNHFPPGDPEYHDISSLVLLERVRDELAGLGWRVGNIDTTIVAERPALGGSIYQMKEQISRVLGIEPGRVSIKATTSEKLGFAGREEGIAVWAVALLEEAETG